MVVHICVDGQRLRVKDNITDIVYGTNNFISFSFTLNEDWNGLAKYALFKQNNTIYTVALDGSNSCNLPLTISPGDIKLLLRGTSQNVTAITKYIEFNVVSNGYVASE